VQAEDVPNRLCPAVLFTDCEVLLFLEFFEREVAGPATPLHCRPIHLHLGLLSHVIACVAPFMRMTWHAHPL
jgi:hypothetical protein